MKREKVFIITLIALGIMTIVSITNSLAGSVLKTIDTAQLHSMIVDNAYRLEGGREKQFTVIDARTKEECDEAHIFSAISIPENDFEKSINLLPKDKDMLLGVYCNDTKFETCVKWAGKAVSAGYKNLSIYSEGFLVWKEKKMPIAPLRYGL
jgi:rhodanese-related sulfurtransferase